MTTTPPIGDSSVPEGVDAPAVGAWLESNIDGATGPFAYELIAGGHSNLTIAVTDALVPTALGLCTDEGVNGAPF